MSERTRMVSIVLLVLASALYVYAPLLPAGFFGSEFQVLEAVAQMGGSVASLYAVPETDGRPLAALSLALSERLWATGPDGVVTWSETGAALLRLENLLFLLVAAVGLRGVLQKALVPFLGAEQARSAGVTAGLFLFLHPLGVATVARVAERGELIAAAAGSLAIGSFLRARQERAPRIMGSAVALALLAGFAGRIAYLLPPLAALLEFLSARRYRPIPARLRTGFVTLLAGYLVLAVEWGLRYRFAPDTLGPPIGQWPELGGLPLALEKLGVLLLPVNTFGIGKVGYALAVIVLLLVLHPGFVAARSAPRLWGRILLGWAIALVLVESFSLSRRVEPGSLAGAEMLFPATILMAVGSAIAATAIHGMRRTLIPALACIAFALLGRGHARPLEKAADHITDLRRQLVAIASESGWSGSYFVLNPLRDVAGVRAIDGPLEHLLDPIFLFEVEPRPNRKLWVGGGSPAALALFSDQPEFRLLCREGLTVLGAQEELDPPQTADRDGQDMPLLRVGPYALEARPREWRGTAGEDHEPFAALAYRWVTLRWEGTEGVQREERPVLRWRGSSGWTSPEEARGVWMRAAEGEIEARFDLSHHLPWLLSGSIESLWLPGLSGRRRTVELRRGPELLPPQVVPRRIDQDWVFDVSSAAALVGPEDREPEWFLELLDLDLLGHQEYALGPAARGRLQAPGLADWVESLLQAGHGPLVWRLDARVDGVTLSRAEGRRALPAR